MENCIKAAISEVNSQDNQGLSALHHAARYGDVKLVDILLDNGADIDLQTRTGRATPLWIAAANGHVDVVAMLIKSGAKYIECCKAMSDQDQDVLKTIADYASQQENKIIACFVLALLASLAIAALGVLAVCGISCSLVLCLAVAIVSCVSSLVFLHLLDKQNTQRQEITSESTEDKSVIGQTDKTSRHKCLVGACVVLHISAGVSAAFCPPLCLVVISILSISLLGIEFSGRTPNQVPEIMRQLNFSAS